MASGDQDFDQRPVFIFFYVLVAVLGILGNSLVCLVLGKLAPVTLREFSK